MAVNSSYAWGKGLLKLFLMVSCCVAFACNMVAHDKTNAIFRSDKYQSRYDYFLFAHIAGAASSLVIYILFLMSVNESCGSRKCWAVLIFFISLILAVACVVAGGLMVEYAKSEYESAWYDLLKDWKLMADLRIAAVAASFCSSLFFFIDALVHFKEVR